MLRITSTEFPKDRARMDGYLQAIDDLVELAQMMKLSGHADRSAMIIAASAYLIDQYKKATEGKNEQ